MVFEISPQPLFRKSEMHVTRVSLSDAGLSRSNGTEGSWHDLSNTHALNAMFPSFLTDPSIYDECSDQSDADNASAIQKEETTFLNGDHFTVEHVLEAGSEPIDVSLPRSGGSMRLTFRTRAPGQGGPRLQPALGGVANSNAHTNLDSLANQTSR